LSQIEQNTRGGTGGGGGQSTNITKVDIKIEGESDSGLEAKIKSIMDDYFRGYLAMGARG